MDSEDKAQGIPNRYLQETIKGISVQAYSFNYSIKKIAKILTKG